MWTTVVAVFAVLWVAGKYDQPALGLIGLVAVAALHVARSRRG